MTTPAPLFPEPAVDLLRDLLTASEEILITTHHRPDGDAVGALLGLARSLRAAGKGVTAHTPDPPPAFLRFLPGFPTITQAPEPPPRYDLVIALDHTELARTGLAEALRDGRVPVITIDHHATADRLATVALIAPQAAATCELLAHLLPRLSLPLDAGTATCLLLGIVTDTGSFQHPNTSAGVFATAASLLAAGADLPAIMSRVFFSGRPTPALRIIGRVLERLQVNPETGAALSFVTHDDLVECGGSAEDLTGVVSLLNTIPEARFSLLLTEVARGKLKGSLRSTPEKAVDVAAIARHLGGGGHRLASGFEVAGRLVRDREGWSVS